MMRAELPWTADRETILSEGVIVASCCFGVRTRKQCEANADFIELAANCHDELVAALAAIRDFWDDGLNDPAGEQSVLLSPDALIGGHTVDENLTICEVVRAALAHAEVKPPATRC